MVRALEAHQHLLRLKMEQQPRKNAPNITFTPYSKTENGTTNVRNSSVDGIAIAIGCDSTISRRHRRLLSDPAHHHRAKPRLKKIKSKAYQLYRYGPSGGLKPGAHKMCPSGPQKEQGHSPLRMRPNCQAPISQPYLTVDSQETNEDLLSLSLA